MGTEIQSDTDDVLEHVHTRNVVLGELLSPKPLPPPPDYDERSHLHDAFTQMTHSLQEMATAQGEWGEDGSSGSCRLGTPKR